MNERKEFSFECVNHNDNINNMRLKNKWCDVTIRVEEREFRAHKSILAANLKYFESTLSQDYFQKSNDSVLTMECVKAKDLEAFIIYAYTGKILLNDINALGYLEVAVHLDEVDIRRACIEFLKTHLRVEDAFRAYKFATRIDCTPLKDAAKNVIILSNFANCLRTIEHLDLDYDSLRYLLIGVNFSGVTWQECLFKFIVNWITNDFEARKNRIKDLLTFIDMKQLTADHLLKCFGDANSKIIEDIMDHYESCTRSRKVKCEVEDMERALVVMGQTIDAKTYVQFYNFAEERWSRRQRIPQWSNVTDYSNCAIMNDKVYYIAKHSGRNHLYAFDLATMRNTQTSLHSSCVLSQTAVCAYDEFVYFCGGAMKDKSRSDQVLRYDPVLDPRYDQVFEDLPRMGSKRAGAVAIVYQGCLHVSGGTEKFEGQSVLKSVERYVPKATKWKKFPSMQEPRLLHALAVLDEKLYACGGTAVRSNVHAKIKCVEFYDPTTKSWWPAADMNKPRAEFLVIAREGKLLAVGGDEEMTVEVYDPDNDLWQMNEEMSAGLQILYLRGGLISANCLASAAIKILFK